MKKIIFLICLQLGLNSVAQNSLLYEISGNGLKQSSYLFGTIHVQDEAVYSWNDSVFWAIDQAQVSAFELDLNSPSIKKDMQPTAEQKQEWEDFLKNDLGPAVQNAIDADTLVDRATTLLTQILRMELGKKTMKRGSFVDIYLKEYAEHRGKKTVGIESVSEQLNVILNLDKKLVKKSIIEFIEEDKWDIDLNTLSGGQNDLIDVYSTMDLEQVCIVVDSIYSGSENALVNQFYKKLFVDRNKIMFNRTSEMIKNESHFIGVGAGHLCSKTGLINQYRKAGYTVRPINITAETSKTIEWVETKTEDYEVLLPKVDNVKLHDEFIADEDEFANNQRTNVLIYTIKGKAAFSIKPMRYNENYMAYYDDEVEIEAVESDEEEMEEYYEEEVDEYYEEAVPDVYYEDAAAESYDEDDYEDMEIYPVEEYVAEEDAVEYMEEEYEVDEITIEVDDDEAFGDVDDLEVIEETDELYDDEMIAAPELTKTNSELTQKEYWEKVSKGIARSAMSKSFELEGLLRMAGEEFTSDTIQVEIMGRPYRLPVEDHFGQSSISVLVESNNSKWQLEIAGDRQILLSDDVLEFFRSFQTLE